MMEKGIINIRLKFPCIYYIGPYFCDTIFLWFLVMRYMQLYHGNICLENFSTHVLQLLSIVAINSCYQQCCYQSLLSIVARILISLLYTKFLMILWEGTCQIETIQRTTEFCGEKPYDFTQSFYAALYSIRHSSTRYV